MTCACLCGGAVNKGRKYINGHNNRGAAFYTRPEYRQKLSNIRAAHCAFFPQQALEAAHRARQGIRRGSSRLEDSVAGMLGPEWSKHVRIRRFVFDFVHEGLKIAVEVNGCFFHSCPRCHPYGAHYNVQKKVTENDARKRRALAAAGYKLAIVWECDLRAEKITVEILKLRLKTFSVSVETFAEFRERA